MISTSPRLPELSFTQERLLSSHIQTSESLDDRISTPGVPSSQIDAHREQTPYETINSLNGSPTKPKSKQGKKSNPLVDLVQTEDIYVTMLSATIRKVAAAWSRTNFPPKELDAMFRGVEAVFKANRQLLSQLKEIDQNPNNPNSAKALGDLLMNWIVDLEKPYTKFANNYMTGFHANSWAPLASNAALPSILQGLTVEYPPDSFSPSPISSWTLDSLFALPRSRLKYYRKLYARLLKSTEAGRSDHNLLAQAIQKLDVLLDKLSERANITVYDGHPQNQASLRSSGQSESNMNTNKENEVLQNSKADLPPTPVERASQLHTPDLSLTPSASLVSTVTELEQRLSTDSVLDLFNLKPRPVEQLQLNPPSLPFTRTIRLSKDVEIHFTPKALPENVQFHPRGCLFLLTDVLLLCERMSAETNGIRLLYPPLAARHLKVSEYSPGDTMLQIIVLKKETITFHLKTKNDRDHLWKHFNKCIEAAATLPTHRSQSPPPPVPPLKPVANEINSPNRMTPSSDNRSQGSQSFSPEAVNNIPIGGLSLNRPADRLQAISQENNNISPHDHPSQATSPNRISASPPSQLPTIQTDFTPVQHSAPQNLYIPPPRGASNAYHPNMQPSGASRSYPNPAPGHLQANVTLHERSLTPNLPHYPTNNQQLGQDKGGGYFLDENPMLRKSVSTTSLNNTYHQPARSSSLHKDHLPEMYAPTSRPDVLTTPQRQSGHSLSSYYPPPQSRSNSIAMNSWTSSYDADNNSPVGSPVDDSHRFSTPIVSTVAGQFKCKVFLKLQHGQWKSLGSAKLKLYLQQPTNIKQLVAESDSKDKSVVLISTIVLTDGVERVGKTGVAIELSDKGARTGIVYMIQLRNEASASGLFDSLLAGSDRAASRRSS